MTSPSSSRVRACHSRNSSGGSLKLTGLTAATSGGSGGSTYTMLVSCAHRQHRQLLSLRTLRLGHNGLTRLQLTSEGEDGDDSSLETSGKQTSSFDTDVSDDTVQLSELLPVLFMIEGLFLHCVHTKVSDGNISEESDEVDGACGEN